MLVINRSFMKRIKNTRDIVGGQTITGSIINGIVNLVTTIYKIGRGLGGGIRRIGSGKVCPL